MIDRITYEILDLDAPVDFSKKPARLHFTNEGDAKVVYSLMQEYAGRPLWHIKKGTPGEQDLFNVYGHFGRLPSKIALLKVHSKVDLLLSN